MNELVKVDLANKNLFISSTLNLQIKHLVLIQHSTAMDRITVKYQPAKRTKHRFINLKVLCRGMWAFIKSLIQFMPEFLVWSVKNMCNFKMKNIEGQIALGKRRL